MENVIHNAQFQHDLGSLEKDDSFTHFYNIAKKYEIQPTLLLEYFKTRKVAPGAVTPSLSIICDEDETAGPAENLEEAQYNYIVMRKFPHEGLSLFIPPGTSQIEISSFIKENWGYIEQKIGKPVRNKRQKTAERNAQILELHKQGLSNHEIIEEVFDKYPGKLTVDDIGVIIRKNK